MNKSLKVLYIFDNKNYAKKAAESISCSDIQESAFSFESETMIFSSPFWGYDLDDQCLRIKSFHDYCDLTVLASSNHHLDTLFLFIRRSYGIYKPIKRFKLNMITPATIEELIRKSPELPDWDSSKLESFTGPVPYEYSDAIEPLKIHIDLHTYRNLLIDLSETGKLPDFYHTEDDEDNIFCSSIASVLIRELKIEQMYFQSLHL